MGTTETILYQALNEFKRLKLIGAQIGFMHGAVKGASWTGCPIATTIECGQKNPLTRSGKPTFGEVDGARRSRRLASMDRLADHAMNTTKPALRRLLLIYARQRRAWRLRAESAEVDAVDWRLVTTLLGRSRLLGLD